MKICLAQTQSETGNITENIRKHLEWIHGAIAEKVDLIVFPELSLTGYEPRLAKELAIDAEDKFLDDFQRISNQHSIIIAVGMPVKTIHGIHISMIIFQAKKRRILYSKQILHSDELPYFVAGKEQIILSLEDSKIVPAICYESMQEEHIQNAMTLGANIYVSSVAKSQQGVNKAWKYYSALAKKYVIPVFMSNAVGFCDNFESAGQSAVWDEQGNLKGHLDNRSEGLLMYDTRTKTLNIKEKELLY